MRTRNILLMWAALFAVAPPVHAGKLERAFNALKVHDYFKARELFLARTKNEPAAAWYGLSVITGRQDNPFYHLDSSWVAVQRSHAAYSVLPEKAKLKLAKLGVDSMAIVAQETPYGRRRCR